MEHHYRKLILVLLWPQIVFAAVGSITELSNAPPSIQRKGSSVTGAKGTGVEMADVVKTTAGKTGITFADDTKVQVNENSKLVIDDFVYDPNSKKGGKLAMNVALGTVRYASGAVAKNNPDSVKINTPTASIAVRGTDFTATVDELGRSTIILLPSCPKGWTDIERDCKTGKIEVSTDEGKVILTQAFQATRVDSRDQKPFKPVILNLEEDQINNLLILSPPKELRESDEEKQKRIEELPFLGDLVKIMIDDKSYILTNEKKYIKKRIFNMVEDDIDRIDPEATKAVVLKTIKDYIDNILVKYNLK